MVENLTNYGRVEKIRIWGRQDSLLPSWGEPNLIGLTTTHQDTIVSKMKTNYVLNTT